MNAIAGPSSPRASTSSRRSTDEDLTQRIKAAHLNNGQGAPAEESDTDGRSILASEAESSNGTLNGTARTSEASQGQVPAADDLGIATNGLPQLDPARQSLDAGDEAAMGADQLRRELERLRSERDSFEGQYRGLLTKLGQMRSTLGDRLRQDAEELDRREQQIEGLNARADELQATVETLKGELVASHEDVDRLSKDLDAARSLHQQQTDSASFDRKGTEARLREIQEMAERYRIDAEGWESACMEERARRDDIDLEIREARRERDEALAREQEQTALAARETETARELQQVLEEFQAAQEGDLQHAIADHEEKLAILSESLREHAERTATAESTAAEHKAAAERCQALDKEVREKNLLIGKLRHEAVILNEHLTESLRRLRASSSDSSVDGKLITNLLIQFLNTPRQDTKRFEMLSLIASVLNWTDEDRERAGLQRSQNATPKGDRKFGVSATASGKPNARRAGQSSSGTASSPTGNEESFSNLFVEFLLSEAEQAKKPAASPADASTSPPISKPGSPQHSFIRASSSAAPTSPVESPTREGMPRPSFNLGSLASIGRKASDAAMRPLGGVKSP